MYQLIMVLKLMFDKLNKYNSCIHAYRHAFETTFNYKVTA